MNLANSERRACARVPFFGQAIVRAAGRHVPCTTVNLSSTGLLVLPAASARAGLDLRVSFKIDHYLGAVDLQAVLAREADYRGTYGWGLRFINVPQRVGSLLQLYVHHRVKSDRDQATTPPLGVGGSDSPGEGQYLKVNRRARSQPEQQALGRTPSGVGPTATRPGLGTGPLGQPSSGEHRAVTPRSQTSAEPPLSRTSSYRSASSGSYRKVAAAHDGAASMAGGDTLPAGAGRSVGRQPDLSQQRRPAGRARPGVPDLRGLGAPTGGPPRSNDPSAPSHQAKGSRTASTTDVGRYLKIGSTRASRDDTLTQTGPPRRGAVPGMSQTGPQRPISAKRASQTGEEPKRRSNPTPVEVRDLYEAALAEVTGQQRKKSKPARSEAKKKAAPKRERG